MSDFRRYGMWVFLVAAALHGAAEGRADMPFLAAGERHTAVLKPDGTLSTWGYNAHGQCDVPAGLGPVIGVAAGYSFTAALKADGTVATWGSASYGAKTVPEGLTGVVAVACGGYHTVVLKADGVVDAWGEDNQGQSTGPRGATNVIAIAAGAERTLVLRADGTVAAWGYDSDNTGKVPAGLTQVKAIAAGYNSAIALKADGRVVAWGRNEYGECTVPAGLSNVIAIAAGDYHSVALKADGTVVGWGDNDYGRRDPPADATGIVAIAAGSYHTVALRADGTLTAWGLNDTEQLDVPAGIHGPHALAGGMSHSLGRLASGTVLAWGEDSEGQCTVPALAGVKKVAAGGFHSVALKADGMVQTWGRSLAGEAGVNLTGITAVAAGREHAVVLRADGRVSAWGDNFYGQCNVPAGLSNVVAIQANGYHTAAVKADGTVIGWGRNDYGQCTIPSGTEPAKEMAVGFTFFGALKPSGTVTAWDYNEYGAATVPPGLALVKDIAAGQHHMAALKADGTVVCWGLNNYGQRTVPEGLAPVASIAPGSFFTLVLKADGTAQGWGDNGSGQLDFPDAFTKVLPGEIAVWNSTPQAETNMAFGPVFVGQSRTETLCISNADSVNDLVLESIEAGGPVGDGTAYAINLLNQSLVSFSLSSPGTVTNIGTAEQSGEVYATEFLDGDFSRLYALDNNSKSLVWYDTATAQRTVVGSAMPASEHTWTGLAEDPTDGTLYASSSYNGTESKLYRINPATGAATEVGAITGAALIIGLAINSKGELYGVDVSLDNLVAINKSTGAGTVIGALGVNANYAQGLDFDPQSDVLYWGAYTSGPELRTIDTDTGSSSLVGAFPADVEVEIAIAGVASDPAFQLQSVPEFPLILPPGSNVVLEVTYTPVRAGTNRTVVVIRCDDADEPEVRVALSGEGVVVPEVGPPLVLPPSAIGTKTFKARWQWAAEAAPEGELCVSSNALFTQVLPGYEALYVLNSPECVVTNLLANRDYWYRVRSLMLDGSASDWSAPMKVRTGKKMPVFRNLLSECPVARGVTQVIALTNLVSGVGRLGVKSSNSEAVKATLTDQALTLQYLWKGTNQAAAVTLTLTHPDSGYKVSARTVLERSTGTVDVVGGTALSNVGTRVVQEVEFKNRTGKTIYGLRVKAGGLDDPAWLINRTGFDPAGGAAIREIPCVLAYGERVTVRLVYHVAYKKQAKTRPVQYQALPVMAPMNGIPPPVTELGGVCQSLYDGLWMIGLAANRNRLYTIWHSDDGGASWSANPPAVRATGNGLMWLDADAAAEPSRLYKVTDSGL